MFLLPDYFVWWIIYILILKTPKLSHNFIFEDAIFKYQIKCFDLLLSAWVAFLPNTFFFKLLLEFLATFHFYLSRIMLKYCYSYLSTIVFAPLHTADLY